MTSDTGWGDFLAAGTPAADSGTAGTAAEPPAGEPAAADQDWADWNATTGDSWTDPGQDGPADDYSALIEDRVETIASDSVVYDDPGAGAIE